MTLTINGRAHSLDLDPPVTLDRVLEALDMKPDRIAVERNGSIVPRTRWADTGISDGDKLEVVHFVGGGALS